MRRFFGILWVFGLLFSQGGCALGAATLSVNGSTAMDQVIGSLSEQFMLDHPHTRVTYDPTGSGAGIQAAKAGTCDVGLSSRKLKDKEIADGLTGTVLALDGIAVIVHPDNPVNGLTNWELRQIYTGELTNWSRLGGADSPIATVGREAGSGTRDGFETAAGIEKNPVYGQELTSTGAVLEAVKANPQAIGYTSLSALSEDVKALTIDGIPCQEATVLDGSYPIQRPFLLVTRSGVPLSETAQAWFDYVTSGDAHDIIRNTGLVPPNLEDTP